MKGRITMINIDISLDIYILIGKTIDGRLMLRQDILPNQSENTLKN